jgi:hypothetical protein
MTSALVLPAMARLPISLGHLLAAWRGHFNGSTGRDWRSVALGFRHIRSQSALGYRQLPGDAGEAQVRAWSRQRFVVEAREESALAVSEEERQREYEQR